MDKGNNEEQIAMNEASSESVNSFPTSNNNSQENTGPIQNTPENAPSVNLAAGNNIKPDSGGEKLTDNPQPEVKNNNSNDFITTMTPQENRKSKFGRFVIVGLIVIALIYGGVFFLYTRNQKIKDGITSMVGSNPIFNTSENSQPSATPTPEFSPEFIKVINGNIVYESGSESKVLVNKNDYPSTGITGFTKATVSPDHSKICFEALPPAIEAGVYLTNSDGTETKQISKNRTRCLFTPDSQRIVYESIGTQLSDIFIYRIDSSTEQNLTDDSSGEGYDRIFHLEGLSADGTRAVCTASDLNGEEGEKCEIDIETGEISYI